MMVLDNIQSRLLGRTIASDSEHSEDKEASHEVCDGGTVSVVLGLPMVNIPQHADIEL
jgi:hypothetical protein